MDASRQKRTETITEESLIKLAHSIDQFEHYTIAHAQQMARSAEKIATRIGLSGVDLNGIKQAALMHDIGEMAMDIAGVRATGVLDFRQRIELWRHPIIGEQQLAKKGLSRYVQLLVRWHHEWWNGSGYPDMLTGEEIPIGARILRLVDTYSALISWRPYRKAQSREEAEAIIAANAGIEFDPYLVKVFLEILAELRVITPSPSIAIPPPGEIPIVEIPPINEVVASGADEIPALNAAHFLQESASAVNGMAIDLSAPAPALVNSPASNETVANEVVATPSTITELPPREEDLRPTAQEKSRLEEDAGNQ